MRRAISILATLTLCAGMIISSAGAINTRADIIQGSTTDGGITVIEDDQIDENIKDITDDVADTEDDNDSDDTVRDDDSGFVFEITNSKKEITAGETFKIKTNIKSIGYKATDITWKSLNPLKIKVNRFGKITAKRAGKAKVEATILGQTATLEIQIKGKKIIGIDAGHQQYANSSTEANGPGSSVMKAKVTSGTTGRYTGIREAVVNLDVAKKLKKQLIKRGYEVVMTHTKLEVDISNKQRAQKLNKAGCDICVRVHCNGLDDSSVKGALCMCASSSNAYVGKYYTESYKLNQAVLDKYCKSTGLKNMGIQINDTLTGTNWSNMPTCLIEMGFMTNESDDRFLCSSDNQDKMAKGIADGIDSYFGY